MSTPAQRSVKISDDERGGWSSDRPRREGAPRRELDPSVSNRVLRPNDRIRYAPGSLLVILGGEPGAADRFAAEVIEKAAGVLSLRRVRGMIEGKVPAGELEERASQLLDAAVAKRLESNEATVVVVESLAPEERAKYVHMAAPMRRPRHLVLIDAGAEAVPEEQRGELNALRNALNAGELGREGFHTALRLGGASVREVKRILFRPEPKDDDDPRARPGVR
jgi:predicted kinase